MASGQCVIHYSSSETSLQNPLQRITKEKLSTIRQRSLIWQSLSAEKQPEKTLADNILTLLSTRDQLTTAVLNTLSTSEPTDSTSTRPRDDAFVLADTCAGAYYCHKTCYVRFTSLSKINRARTQKRKVSFI